MRKVLRHIWSAMTHHRYVWTIVFFVLIAGFLDPSSFYHWYQMRSQNDLVREEIKVQEELCQEATDELNMLERDPQAVERVARVEWHMKSADEDVYIIE